MNSATERKVGKWDAGRVLRALGRIGYHPVSALLDIADNSLSAGATKIAVKVETSNAKSDGSGRPRAVISGFSVMDNGCGMDEAGLDNALTLGSSTKYYHQGTLSKFGMGLKSAAFSLGSRLEIISRPVENGTIRKAVLDQDTIDSENGSYVYEITEVDTDEQFEFESFCGSGSGTIVRIKKIHSDSMPKPSEIFEGLTTKAGVVYHYYLSGLVDGWSPLTMTIHSIIDGHIDETINVEPIDPLFEVEAEGDLDEKNWDGLSVRWITKNIPVQLDTSGQRFADVAITQLPHPPSVQVEAGGDNAARIRCRDRYLIEAGNYGFYIYRNYRLISWADRLEGMIPRDKKLYGFRGRIMISSDADDLLNIDVTKSRIHLSEIASRQLRPEISEAKSMSQRAWQYRTNILRDLSRLPPHAEINEELDRVAKLAEKDDELDEQVAPAADKKKLAKRRKRATSTKPATEEEEKKLREEGQRVQLVDYLENNQLWERAHDPSNGLVVRVNQSHRFFREVMIDEEEDSKLVKVLDLLFFALARGEYSVIYKYEDLSEDQCERVMQELRERTGAELSEIIRRMDKSVFSESDD